MLRSQDIIPGIKVDLGAKPLAGADGEQVTEGLDGLRERLDEYAKLGAKFTKWRGVIAIGDHIAIRLLHSVSTRMPWGASPRCPRRSASFLSLSPKC